MSKLHELLAVEDTVVQAADKLLSETNEKFSKITEFFTGHVKTLERLNDSPEDRAIEAAQRKLKELPTNVPATVGYVLPFVTKALNLKLQKHLTNQIATADIMLDNSVLMSSVPVDFLLDLEKALPKLRATFAIMPTLDPSREWVREREGVWKSKEPVATAQTEKVMYPVVLHEGNDKHPPQVKESTRDNVVGTFKQIDFSGAATSQQKADLLALCDKLLVAVKQARMRANSVEVAVPVNPADQVTALFAAVFKD